MGKPEFLLRRIARVPHSGYSKTRNTLLWKQPLRFKWLYSDRVNIYNKTINIVKVELFVTIVKDYDVWNVLKKIVFFLYLVVSVDHKSEAQTGVLVRVSAMSPHWSSNLVEKWNHSCNLSRTHNSHDGTVQKDGSTLSHCKQSGKY